MKIRIAAIVLLAVPTAAMVFMSQLAFPTSQAEQIQKVEQFNRWDKIEQRIDRIDAAILEIEQRLDALLEQ